MKIQELAIIFIIIILPISLVLSAYTQFQIKTLNLQTLYDTKLTTATFDAIKAFQLNTANSTMSDLSNSKLRDIEASVATFKKSIMSAFGLSGSSEEDLNNYIPALVYTMYDGFYIYSPYTNTNYLGFDNDGETMYGLKPYITYSCRYQKGTNTDFVITYSLDNYITIQGTIEGDYVNNEGYLIDGITKDASGKITYNGITITAETELKESVGNIQRGGSYVEFPYIKLNGTKYYYDDNATATTSDDEIFYISNGKIAVQGEYRGNKAKEYYDTVIANNQSAYNYYDKAYSFTKWVKEKLGDLRYKDAEISVQKDDGTTEKLFEGNNTKIFDDTSTNIENELSNFNQHRLAIIKNLIRSNLSIAIANYNKYSNATEIEFQMPELKDEEWELVMNKISLISFVQGLNIGGKIYNGYTIVNNSESKEVVQEENIYILGNDGYYHRIGDNYLTESNGDNIVTTIPAGRLNLDFKRQSLTTSTDLQTKYYYPLRNYYASYDSIVTQNNVTTYDDIYDYIKNSNDKLKKAFYMALGREREGAYKALRTDM